ncbi:MAG TPA: DNA mismatch repair protein MutS, partial [Burkholderiaceae bacterium]|nr:DNA mismatch repair protein MutS [Burkholderiaceae bacterium]
ITASTLADWHFDYAAASETLKNHFEVETLAGFELNNYPLATSAAGALLHYVLQTQKQALSHIRSIRIDHSSSYVVLDPVTRQNLELTDTLSGEKGPSLFSTLDHCRTPMGSRLLRRWLHHPLRDNQRVKERQEAIAALANPTLAAQSSLPDNLNSIRHYLQQLPDIERIATRIALGSARPRELASLRDALTTLPELQQLLAPHLDAAFLLTELSQAIQLPPQPLQQLQSAIAPEPAALLREGGVIADGHDAELDELRTLSSDTSHFLIELESRERKRTGIHNLRVQFNRVHGYFIEVSRGQADNVPADYQRRQTLKNAERFITPELKEWEDKILSASERALAREKWLYEQLIETLQQWAIALHDCAAAIAQIDTLAALAWHATNNDWVAPTLSDSNEILLENGRHPVVEHTIERFIPNDCTLDAQHQLLLITGPNMGGKSTYMRQVALITLLARVGSFVPASAATVGPIDRIFTRIGAADDLAGGRSTFMVEMTEAATILAASTAKSLVLLDEIGRGTSTYDGLALAWAIAERLLTHNHALTLFATHYFEMTQLAQHHPQAHNAHLAAADTPAGIAFLYELRPGPASRSYGIQVAQRAGLPPAVIRHATQKLRQLENLNAPSPQLDLFAAPAKNKPTESKPPEPELEPSPLIEALTDIEPDNLTPREALNELYRLKLLLGSNKQAP